MALLWEDCYYHFSVHVKRFTCLKNVVDDRTLSKMMWNQLNIWMVIVTNHLTSWSIPQLWVFFVAAAVLLLRDPSYLIWTRKFSNQGTQPPATFNMEWLGDAFVVPLCFYEHCKTPFRTKKEIDFIDANDIFFVCVLADSSGECVPARNGQPATSTGLE